MDKIQKILIKAGRKDLAQEYFNKISLKIDPKIAKEKALLDKLKPLWKELSEMNGGGFFINDYETFDELKKYVKKNGYDGLLKDIESNYEHSEEGFHDSISNEDTSTIKSITISKEELEKVYDKVYDIVLKLSKLS